MKASQQQTESQIQQAFVKVVNDILLYRFPCLRWLHAIPNGVRVAGIGAAVKARREGMTAGIADMFLPYPRDCWHGLYLEFKRGKKGRLSKSQEDFRDWCDEFSYKFCVVHSVETGIQILQEYITAPRPLRFANARNEKATERLSR